MDPMRARMSCDPCVSYVYECTVSCRRQLKPESRVERLIIYHSKDVQSSQECHRKCAPRGAILTDTPRQSHLFTVQKIRRTVAWKELVSFSAVDANGTVHTYLARYLGPSREGAT